MPLVIDHQPVATDRPRLATVGDVLTHLQRENRLVVQVLIDGEEPDFEQPAGWRSTSTDAHTVFVETTEPQTMARDVLDEVQQQISDADRLGSEAARLVQAGQHTKAMENLSACFKRWQHVQEAILKISQLLRLDLNRVLLPSGRPVSNFFGIFGAQLRNIRDALEARDYVGLSDALTYELAESVQTWRDSVEAIRAIIDAP